MNKKIIKTLSLIVFVFAALMFAPQRAFSLTVDTFTVTAFISFPDPKEVTLTHKQEIKVLNSSSIFITGNVASTFPGFNVHSISSVTITYNYDISSDSDTVVQADLTSDANTVFFEAVLSDLFLANSHIFYQIKVAYTLDGSSGTKTSAWHIVNNPNIKHTHLAGISALDKVFSPIGLAENLEIQKRTLYTSPMSYQFEIQYYYGEDNANISTAAIKLIGSNFEMESYSHILPADVSTFSYRIVVRYDGEAEREKRIPSIGYISVPVITSSSSIIGVNGGTATLYQGDQHYGNTSVSVSSGVLSDSATITITQLPTGAQIASSNIFVASQDIKKHYKIEFDNPDSYDKTYTVTLFAGDKEDYEIVYRNSEAGLWRKLDKYKNTDGTYSVLWTKDKYGALSRVNYFAVAAVNAARDVNSSVRPSIRAFMPGATVTFNNLKDGDTIAIYNLKGKLVKKITQIKPDGTAQWDGRNDSGNYVESGSYIYQVKADGKIISGSLAFVR